MMNTPFVMVYRVTPLTYALGKPRVKVPYFAMVNLIAGEKVVPELVQDDFTAENVVAELRKIVPDGPDRFSLLEGLASVKARLRGNRVVPAAETAGAIVSLLLRVSRTGVHTESAEVNLSG